MADRYWRGGSGSWNTTTNWSATSGGTGGASVPTAADNVIFDINSGAGTSHYTVTVTDNATCANLTFTPETIAGISEFAVGNGFVIAGTFSTSSTAGNRRLLIRSSTYGLIRKIQIAAIGSVSDVDFRDIEITGAGGTLSGTRIGNLGGNSGITFSTPKTVYWTTSGGSNFAGNNWAATIGGAASTDNFPLAQDTAAFPDTGLGSGSSASADSIMPHIGSIDMSMRTVPMVLSVSASIAVYGNWTNSSAISFGGGSLVTFAGRKTQTITSAGKNFGAVDVNSPGGSVELADAFSAPASSITVTRGTFDTKGYAVSAGSLVSNNSNLRTINLGASTVTLSLASPVNFVNSTGLTLNAGTSQINLSSTANTTFAGGGMTFNSVSYTGTTASLTHTVTDANTFSNFTVTAPATAGFVLCAFNTDQTITNTLTVAGASPVLRVFVYSSSLGTPRTLTVNSLSATDCDFRDITIAGTAAGSSPTRAGDCGGNLGIVFPAPKTVYWNLAGSQNWSATAWAASSGGTPNINNFPLSQDTAVFDNTGAAGTVTLNAIWNTGTFDASARTTAMTFSVSTLAIAVYGDWKFGTGVTSTSTTGFITFAGRGTKTITSNGREFGCAVSVDCITGTVQLADALTLNTARIFRVYSGTFDAVTYNVTTGRFSASSNTANTVKMGSGLWTLTGTGTVWDVTPAFSTLHKGTADILLSTTSTAARTFLGNSLSYNKLTIAGTATSLTTTTISGNNQFTELASTKTTAHIISLGTTAQTFGKWTVTGTAGNVVTLQGTGTGHILAGACTSGIDYLAMGSIGFAATSPGEFYAGPNSTGTAAAPVYRTAKPADGTRYWVGGTGNWSDSKWSDTSGGFASGDVPRSHDDVIFNSASNATAYTVTVNAVTGGIRCKSLTVTGPASGNLTLAGSTAIVGIHGNITLPATGLTRTYNGTITLSGSTTGRTFTTNGVVLASPITVNGVGCGWTLGSALDIMTSSRQPLTVTNGSFDTGSYNLSVSAIISNFSNTRAITLGSSTVTISANSATSIEFGSSEVQQNTLTFSAGTSQINISRYTSNCVLNGNGQTFYNVSLAPTVIDVSGTYGSTITGSNTFNNLTIESASSTGILNNVIFNNQTVLGTFTCSGFSAISRNFVRSDTVGITCTITATTLVAADCDFRDIAIAGAAAGTAPTRAGDCDGNSGIVFPAPKTVYRVGTNVTWAGSNSWALTSNGSGSNNNFPLAQDTVIINNFPTPSQLQFAAFNIGTLDTSQRTTSFSFASTSSPSVYGSFILSTSITGTYPNITFRGRRNMLVDTAGRTVSSNWVIDAPAGTVKLDSALSGPSITLTQGTFDANNYNVTIWSFSSNNSNIRQLIMGSGLWTLTLTGTIWDTGNTTNFTFNKGSANILSTNTSATTRTFSAGNLSYNKLTVGGEASTAIFSIQNSANCRFSELASTRTAAYTLSFASQQLVKIGKFSVSGSAGNVVIVQSSSGVTPQVFSIESITRNVNYLNVQRVHILEPNRFYVGLNSIDGGNIFNVLFSNAPSIATNNMLMMF